MTTLRKLQIQNQENISSMPDSAFKLLNVLDKLEDFTVSIRKKVMSEIKTSNKLIHVKLDSL